MSTLAGAIGAAVVCIAASGPQPSPPECDEAVLTVRAFMTALGNADLDRLVATFDDAATAFLPITDAPSRLSGKAAIRDAFQPFLDGVRRSGPGPPYMTLAPRDIEARPLSGDACLITLHLGALPEQGAPQAVVFSRRTFVLKRRDAVWRIVHLHASNVRIEPERKED